ncbi:MAG: zinc-ribbon domain-containing protein, partial [Planctomycetaceae bacterium]|nr:zinc-ribbon domain-containing protein [Planctomycetaceae bacterium]
MITFSCSCGKKYQLPDRLAGREVRCNQCGNALIIPTSEQSETIESTDDIVTSATETKHENTQWGKIPVPNGEKNEQSPIVSGWATGPYQKGSSCILTIVLVLLGAGSAFFAGFLAGSLLHRIESTHYDEQSKYAETDHEETEYPNNIENSNNNATKYSASDWKIDENSLTLFAVQTADNGQIQISLDHNPPAIGEKNKT